MRRPRQHVGYAYVLERSGRKLFESKIEPSLEVCRRLAERHLDLLELVQAA